MRIISQDNDFDIYYENSVLSIVGNIIYAFSISGMKFYMGEYESKEEAKETLEDILHNHSMKNRIYVMPKKGWTNED